MATVIFTPADDIDTAIQGVRSAVEKVVKGKQPLLTGPGQEQLGSLQNEDSDLYVVGHGSFGLGVGSHTTHYGGGRLAALLVEEGLEKVQKNLQIFVVACNSGVAMERGQGRRRPYVERLAEALANRGFVNTTVTGFGGFISENLYSSLRYANGEVENTKFNSGVGNPAQVSIFSRKVVYTVANNKATSTSTAWKAKTSKREMLIKKRE